MRIKKKKMAQKNIPSMEEFREIIQESSNVMSCEGRGIDVLLEFLEREAKQDWILEIDVLCDLFEVRKLKLNMKTTSIQAFRLFCGEKVSLDNTILKVLPVKY